MKQIFRTATLSSIVYLTTFSYALADDCGVELFGTCQTDEGCLACWLRQVFDWSLGIILTLSVVIIMLAGFTYMTSTGNPARISTSKKMIWGALTAVAVMVLGRFFLKYVIGVPWLGD